MTSSIAISGSDDFQFDNAALPLPAVSYHARMNVVRFIAICSVVWGHCSLGLENRVFSNEGFQLMQAVSMQAGRVGTIMFFIISGFLLFDKIERFTPLTYLRYRLYSLIIPWLSFIAILVFFQVFHEFTLKEILQNDLSATGTLVWQLAKGSVFHAAYWFIPIAIFSSVLLIALKRYIRTIWLGLVLAGLSLLYCINLYVSWVPVLHTTAVLGYVFYLWLGMFIKLYINKVIAVLKGIPAVMVVFALIVGFLVACAEAINLSHIGCADSYASLRLSNAELSVLLFAVLLKSHRLSFIDYLQPQKNTYGIYLMHSLIIMVLAPIANNYIASHNAYFSWSQFITVQITFFTCVFALSFLIVSVIRRSSLRVILGIARQ